jgi:hypothetical protein
MDLFAVGKLLLPLLSLWGIIVGVVLIIDGVLKLRKRRLLGVVFVLVGVFFGWYSFLGLLVRLSQL